MVLIEAKIVYSVAKNVRTIDHSAAVTAACAANPIPRPSPAWSTSSVIAGSGQVVSTPQHNLESCSDFL